MYFLVLSIERNISTTNQLCVVQSFGGWGCKLVQVNVLTLLGSVKTLFVWLRCEVVFRQVRKVLISLKEGLGTHKWLTLW